MSCKRYINLLLVDIFLIISLRSVTLDLVVAFVHVAYVVDVVFVVGNLLVRDDGVAFAFVLVFVVGVTFSNVGVVVVLSFVIVVVVPVPVAVPALLFASD